MLGRLPSLRQSHTKQDNFSHNSLCSLDLKTSCHAIFCININDPRQEVEIRKNLPASLGHPLFVFIGRRQDKKHPKP